MYRVFWVAILLVLPLFGCAQKQFSQPRKVGVVQSETKVLDSMSKQAIRLTFDESATLQASLVTLTESQVKRREQIKYEKCWTVKRGVADGKMNPITGLIALSFDIVSIPFAILQAIFEPVKPGCTDWTRWEDWKGVSEVERSERPLSGTVSFSSNNPHLVITPAKAETDGQGVAEAQVSFHYPYLSPQQASSLPVKTERSVTVRATNGKASEEVEIVAYDVGDYMGNLVPKYFEQVEINVSDQNTRLPIAKAQVRVFMDDGYDIENYLSRTDIPKQLRHYFAAYLFSRYGEGLKKGRYTAYTDQDGSFQLLVPKQIHNVARKIELRHPEYYYREIPAVRLTKNFTVEKRVANAIFMKDLGRKVRTSTD